jgi:large subunit ribosomal protein L6
MSRIGKKVIPLPDKVEAKAEGSIVKVKGPLGELSQKLPAGLGVVNKDKVLTVTLAEGGDRAVHGAVRAQVANMVEGVSKGFNKTLEIVGLGFRSALTGEKLTLTIGFSHPVDFMLPKGIKAVIDAKANSITLSGIDKALVGETAARIRGLKVPEPYKGTGIKYKGEHILRKAGKTAATAGAGGGAKK